MDAALHAAARHPNGERVRVVIAPRLVALLRDRQPAKFARANHQRVLEQTALREVFEQSGERLVGLAREAGVIADEIHVAVPRELILHAAAVNLHEPRAPLHEPPRHEALRRDVRAVRLIEPVEFADAFRLLRQIERVRRGGLHAVSQLEAVNARGQFAVGGRRRERGAVELREEIKLLALARRGEVGGTREVVDRLALRLEPGALIHAGQKARGPVARVAFRQAAILRVAHHDERRQILARRAQPVRHPRARARVAHARHARVHHEKRGRVIVRLRVHRVDERHAVHMLREIWKQRADPRTALPVLRPLEGRLHQRPHGVGKKSRLRIEARQRLAVALLQLGFVIPSIHMALPPIHKKPDHRFRLRRKVRRLRRERIRRRGGGSAREQRIEREQAEARAGALEQMAAGEVGEGGFHFQFT